MNYDLLNGGKPERETNDFINEMLDFTLNESIDHHFNRKEIQAKNQGVSCKAKTNPGRAKKGGQISSKPRITDAKRKEQRKAKDKATLEFIERFKVANWKIINILFNEPRTTIISRMDDLVNSKAIKKAKGFYCRRDYTSNTQDKHNLFISGIAAELIVAGKTLVSEREIRNESGVYKFGSILIKREFIPDLVNYTDLVAIEVEITAKTGKAKTQELWNKIYSYKATEKYKKVIYYTDCSRVYQQLETKKEEVGIGAKMEIVMVDYEKYM